MAYVLSGEVTFMIGDEVTVGGAGTCAFMPRGVPHAWKSTGAETARVLFLYTPAKVGGVVGGAPPDWPQLRVDERARGHRDLPALRLGYRRATAIVKRAWSLRRSPWQG